MQDESDGEEEAQEEQPPTEDAEVDELFFAGGPSLRSKSRANVDKDIVPPHFVDTLWVLRSTSTRGLMQDSAQTSLPYRNYHIRSLVHITRRYPWARFYSFGGRIQNQGPSRLWSPSRKRFAC